MLPGKCYQPEDIVRIIVRRAWLILPPIVLGASVAFAVAAQLPDVYRSETLIMLEPKRVPDEYVKSIAPVGVDDRLVTLEGQILSRSRLERIITDLGLYESLRRTMPMEDVVERMRADITLKIETKASFRVSYISYDARTAQQAAERLSSLFIEESMRDRETLAEDTNGFLDSQLEEAKRQLIAREKTLEEYRTRNGSELPSQAATNLQAMQNVQAQLQSVADGIDRDREHRLLLERQLSDLQSQTIEIQPVASAEPGSGSTEQQLAAAQEQLQTLLTRAKPDHPDVRTLQRRIRDLQATLQVEAERPRTTAEPSRPLTPAMLQRQRRIRDLNDQISDVDRQLAEKEKQEQALRLLISGYQVKLEAVPKRESELIELTRDYATLQTTYQSLLAKRQDAKIASNLEQRNIGPQFKVLDPPKVPERPFKPNRPLIDLGGAAAGLALGVLLIGVLEYRDSSFKCENDVVRLLKLPVLAMVPVIISPAERRARQRRVVLAGIAAVVVVMGTAAVIVATGMQLHF